jgi:hypothetical protein
MKLKNFLLTVLRHPLVERALHSFWQGFLAGLLLSGGKLDKATLVAAVVAGLSAAKGGVLTYLQGRKG